MACPKDNDRVPAVSLESLDYLLNNRRSINLSELPSTISDRNSTSSDDGDSGIKIINTFSLAKNVGNVKTGSRQIQKIPHLTSDEKIANKVVKYDQIDDYAITSFKSLEVADAFDQCLKCDDNVVDMESQFLLFRLISSHKAQTQEGLQPILEPDMIVQHRKKGFRGLNGRMRKFDRILAKSLSMKNLVSLSDAEDDSPNENVEALKNVDSCSTSETTDSTEKPVTIKEEIDDDNIWAKIERDSQQTQPVFGEDVDSIFHSKQLDELLQQESVRLPHRPLFNKIDSFEPVNKIRFETPSTQSSYIKTLDSALKRKRLADANDNVASTVSSELTEQSAWDLPDSKIDNEVDNLGVPQLSNTRTTILPKILRQRIGNDDRCFTEIITKHHAQVAISALKTIDDKRKTSLKNWPLVYDSLSVCSVPESNIPPVASRLAQKRNIVSEATALHKFIKFSGQTSCSLSQKRKFVSEAPIPQKVNKFSTHPRRSVSQKQKFVSETPIPRRVNKFSSHPRRSVSNIRKALSKHGINHLFSKNTFEKSIHNLRETCQQNLQQKLSSWSPFSANVENYHQQPRTDDLKQKMEDSARKFLRHSRETRTLEVPSNDVESDQIESCSRVVPYHKHSARQSCGNSVQHRHESNTEQGTKSTTSSTQIESSNIQTKTKDSFKIRTIDSILQYINNSNSSVATVSTDPTDVVNGNIWTMYAIVNLPEAEMISTSMKTAGSWMGSTRVFKIFSHCEDWIKSKVAILRVILSMDLNIEKRMLWYASAEIGEYFIEILLRAKGRRECCRLLPGSVMEVVDITQSGQKSTFSMVQIYKRNVRKIVIKKEDEQLNDRTWRQMLEIDRLQLIHFTTTNHWQKEVPEILGFTEADKDNVGKENVKKYHLQMCSSGRQIKIPVAAEGVSNLCKNIITLSKSSSLEKASEVEKWFQKDVTKVEKESYRVTGESHSKEYSCKSVPSVVPMNHDKATPTKKIVFVRNISSNTRNEAGLPCVVGYSKQQQISISARGSRCGNISSVESSHNGTESPASLNEQPKFKCGSIQPLPTISSPRIYQYEPVTASSKSLISNAKKIVVKSSQKPTNSRDLQSKPVILGKRSGVNLQEKFVAKQMKKAYITSVMSSTSATVSCAMTTAASVKVNASTHACRIACESGLTKLAPKQVVLSSPPYQAKLNRMPCSTGVSGTFALPAVVVKKTKVACTLTSSTVPTSANSALFSSKNKFTLLNVPIVNPTAMQVPSFSKPETTSMTSATYTLESDGLKYSLVPVTNIGVIPSTSLSNASSKKHLVVQPALVSNAQGEYSFRLIKLSTANTITSATLTTHRAPMNAECTPGVGKLSEMGFTSISEIQSMVNMPQASQPTSWSGIICTAYSSSTVYQSPSNSVPLHVRNPANTSCSLPPNHTIVNMLQGNLLSRSSDSISSKKFPIVRKTHTVLTASDNWKPTLKNLRNFPTSCYANSLMTEKSSNATLPCASGSKKLQLTNTFATEQKTYQQSNFTLFDNCKTMPNTSYVTGMTSAPLEHIDKDPVLSYSQETIGKDAGGAEKCQAGPGVGNAKSSVEKSGLPSANSVPTETLMSRCAFGLPKKASVGFMNKESTSTIKDKHVTNEGVDFIDHQRTHLKLDQVNLTESDRLTRRTSCSFSQTNVANTSMGFNLCDSEKCLLKQIQDIRMSSKIEPTKRKNVSLRTYSMQPIAKGNAEKEFSEKLKQPKNNCDLETMSPENLSVPVVLPSDSKRTSKRLPDSIAIEFFAPNTTSRGTADNSSCKNSGNSSLSVNDNDISQTDDNALLSLACSTKVADDLLSYDHVQSTSSVSTDCTTKTSAPQPSSTSTISLVQHGKGNVHRLALRKFSNCFQKNSVKQALKSLTQAEISKFNVECLANVNKIPSRMPITKSEGNGSKSLGSNLKLRVRMTKNTAMKLLNQTQSNKSVPSVPLKVLNNTTLSGKSLLEAVGFAASKKSKLRIRMKKDTASHVTGLNLKNTSSLKSSDMLGSYAKRIFGAIVQKVSQNSLDPVQVDTKMNVMQKRKENSQEQRRIVQMGSLGKADNIAHCKQAISKSGDLQKNGSQNSNCKRYYARRSSSTKQKEFLDNASKKSVNLPQTTVMSLGVSGKSYDAGKMSSTPPSRKSLIKVNVPDDVPKVLKPEADAISGMAGKVVESELQTTSSKSRNLFDDIMSSIDMESHEHTASPQTIVGNSSESFPGDASDVIEPSHNCVGFFGSKTKYPTPKTVGDKDGKTSVDATTTSSSVTSIDHNVAQSNVDSVDTDKTSSSAHETTRCLREPVAPLSQSMEDFLKVSCAVAQTVNLTGNSDTSHSTGINLNLDYTKFISSGGEVDVVDIGDTSDRTIPVFPSVVKKRCVSKSTSPLVSDPSQIPSTALTNGQCDCPITEQPRAENNAELTFSDEDVDVVGMGDAANSTKLKSLSVFRKRSASRRAAPAISDSSQKSLGRLIESPNAFPITGKIQVLDRSKLTSSDEDVDVVGVEDNLSSTMLLFSGVVNKRSVLERASRSVEDSPHILSRECDGEAHRLKEREKERRKELRAKYQRLRDLVGGGSKISILLKATTECEELKKKEATLMSQVWSLKQLNVELNDRRKRMLSNMLSLERIDSVKKHDCRT